MSKVGGRTMTKNTSGKRRHYRHSVGKLDLGKSCRMNVGRSLHLNIDIEIDKYMLTKAKKRVEQFHGNNLNLIDADDIVQKYDLDIDEIFAMADQVELED